jgi:hypothetical protein
MEWKDIDIDLDETVCAWCGEVEPCSCDVAHSCESDECECGDDCECCLFGECDCGDS